MHQAQYIRTTIDQMNVERAGINETFAKEVREIDAAIETLVLASDKGAQIVALRMKKEEVRTRLTARAANMTGQIEALTTIFNRYHQNPVPPGTIIHGIDVSVLDWETRAKIMAGDAETVALFGGAIIMPVDEPAPARTVETAPAEPSAPAVKRKR